MLEGLFSQLATPTPPIIKVPPVPSPKTQREPLQATNGGAVPWVPQVPPEKTKVETKNTNSTLKAADQHKAAMAIRVYCYRVKEKPHSELMVIMPDTELDEAYEKLRLKFGDRLLTVYESKAKGKATKKGNDN
ncbi:MAG: hypothetical protein QX199_13255 [Methylococcaceae bacterium]